MNISPISNTNFKARLNPKTEELIRKYTPEIDIEQFKKKISTENDDIISLHCFCYERDEFGYTSYKPALIIKDKHNNNVCKYLNKYSTPRAFGYKHNLHTYMDLIVNSPTLHTDIAEAENELKQKIINTDMLS